MRQQTSLLRDAGDSAPVCAPPSLPALQCKWIACTCAPSSPSTDVSLHLTTARVFSLDQLVRRLSFFFPFSSCGLVANRLLWAFASRVIAVPFAVHWAAPPSQRMQQSRTRKKRSNDGPDKTNKQRAASATRCAVLSALRTYASFIWGCVSRVHTLSR